MISVELKISLQKGQRNLEIRASRLPDFNEEFGIRIDEPGDQPGTCHAVNMNM